MPLYCFEFSPRVYFAQVTAFHKKQVPIFAAGLGGSALEPSKGSSTSTPSHSSQEQQSQQQQQQQSTISPNASSTIPSKQLPAHPAPPELPPSLGVAAASRVTAPSPTPKSETMTQPAALLVDTSGSKGIGSDEMKKVADSKPLDRVKKVRLKKKSQN